MMRLVCAWCKAVMREGPPEPVSHGICPACLETAERQYSLTRTPTSDADKEAGRRMEREHRAQSRDVRRGSGVPGAMKPAGIRREVP
jgi:hypothetical protein